MQLNICNITHYLLLKLKQVTVEMLLQSLISKVYAQLLKTVFLVPIPRVVRLSYKCQKEYQYIHLVLRICLNSIYIILRTLNY